MKVAIYSRVSTTKQETENQVFKLIEYCDNMGYEVFKVYIDDAVSGISTIKPRLEQMMDAAFERKFDIVLVWKLDRLGRSLKEIINILDKLKEKNIDFVCLTQKIDTTTSSGKLMFHIIGAFAEFERDLISERVKLGLERAKRNGVKLGRPKVDEELIQEALEMREVHNASIRTISEKTGLSIGKVHEILVNRRSNDNN